MLRYTQSYRNRGFGLPDSYSLPAFSAQRFITSFANLPGSFSSLSPLSTHHFALQRILCVQPPGGFRYIYSFVGVQTPKSTPYISSGSNNEDIAEASVGISGAQEFVRRPNQVRLCVSSCIFRWILITNFTHRRTPETTAHRQLSRMLFQIPR